MNFALPSGYLPGCVVAAALLTFVANADAVDPAVTKVKDKFMITAKVAMQSLKGSI